MEMKIKTGITEVNELMIAQAERYRRIKEENMTGLEKDVQKYIDWCEANGKQPNDGYALVEYMQCNK